MELLILFAFGCVIVGYFLVKKDDPIGNGITRLNRDIEASTRKLKNPNRNGL